LIQEDSRAGEKLVVRVAAETGVDVSEGVGAVDVVGDPLGHLLRVERRLRAVTAAHSSLVDSPATEVLASSAARASRPGRPLDKVEPICKQRSEPPGQTMHDAATRVVEICRAAQGRRGSDKTRMGALAAGGG